LTAMDKVGGNSWLRRVCLGWGKQEGIEGIESMKEGQSRTRRNLTEEINIKFQKSNLKHNPHKPLRETQIPTGELVGGGGKDDAG